MILDECLTFVLMFAAGLLAGIAATFLLALGGGSKAARAVFDFFTPIAVGAIFFFALMIASEGVFRWYAPVAFVLGGGIQRILHKKIFPVLCRLAKRGIVPIKSLTESLENALKRVFGKKKETAQE